MKREFEIDFVVSRLENNPTDEELARAVKLIYELYRECTNLELTVERVSNDYWSK